MSGVIVSVGRSGDGSYETFYKRFGWSSCQNRWQVKKRGDLPLPENVLDSKRYHCELERNH